jgi:hypothetical protein
MISASPFGKAKIKGHTWIARMRPLLCAPVFYTALIAGSGGS